MTPEEKAIIEAAIKWADADTTIDSDRIEDAAEALQDSIAALRRKQAYFSDASALVPQPKSEVEWVETTMRQCLAGDRIRLGAEETTVIRASTGIWHADTSDAWHPKAWEHVELRMELQAVPQFVQYPPNASVEILCTPERKAVLLMQSAFPGSAVTSSDVN